MPVEPSTTALARQRRVGLRVALAVAAGLTFDVAIGAIIPFLGPIFAAQFLLSSNRPLPMSKAIGMVVLVLVVGQASILLSGVFGDRPAQLLLLLGLFYFVCFFIQAQGKGGPAIFISLVIAIIVPLLNLVHDKLDSSVIAVLLQACASGALMSWLAHALVPERDGGDEAEAPKAPEIDRPASRALASTMILLAAVTICLTHSRFSTALVIPITVASLLLQPALAASSRAALGLVAVNLLGGVMASLAFAFIELRPSLPVLFLTILLAGLVLGGRAASSSATAKIYAGALTTFLILFGTGISPLPTTTPESFSTRIGYVLLAIAYSLAMTSVLWSRPRYGTLAAGRST